MTKTPGVSLAMLDATKASEAVFEFEFILDGQGTGVFLSVIGGQAKAVTDALARQVDEQRRSEALAEIKAKTGGRKDEPVVRPYQSDIDTLNMNAAGRLVGWRGIAEPFTPELGLVLCATNADARMQTLEKSNNMGNFIKLSPTT